MKRPARARLSSAERRLLLLLGAPGLGLSLSLTVISTYLPVLARGFTGSRAGIGAPTSRPTARSTPISSPWT